MTKLQITNYKLQIISNYQNPNDRNSFDNSLIGIWNLFVIRCLKFGICLYLVSCFLVISSVWAEQVARIIAKINNQVITSRDLDDYCKVIQYKLTDSRDSIPSEDAEFRTMALSRLIEDKLTLDQAKRMSIEIPRAVIDGRIDQIIKSHPTREAFEESLRERGLTVTKLKEKIKEQYLMRELIQVKIRSSIAISPQAVSAYYAENQSKMLSAVGYIFYIATSKDRDELDQIIDKIETKGIARAHSDYQDELTKMKSAEGELKPQIADILNKLKGGQSEIVEIGGIHYLVYLEQKLKPKKLKLSETQEAIRVYLGDQEFKQKFADWVKELKEQAVIKIYNE